MVGQGSLVGLPHEPDNPRRLPLHLAYRLDTPGTYEVRYLGYDFRYPMEKHVLARSPWNRIRVRPFFGRLTAGVAGTHAERRLMPRNGSVTIFPLCWPCRMRRRCHC